MFPNELNTALGNFFYFITGIGNNVSVDESISMQESITEVWRYFSQSGDRNFATNEVSIVLSFDIEEIKTLTENHFKYFEKFYIKNRSSFTPDIIVDIMRTSEAIAQSYYESNEVETKVMNQLEKIFFR